MLSPDLVERLNLSPGTKDRVTSPYHQQKWHNIELVGERLPKTQLPLISLDRLPNPEYDWTFEAYRVQRGQYPALEAVFFCAIPPSIAEEVAQRVRRDGQYVTEDRLKLFLDLEQAVNPNIFPAPPKKLHHQRYRFSPSGLTLEGVSVFPFLSLADHLQQALNPNSPTSKITPFFIPFIFVRAFPYYSTDPKYPPTEAVGENRKRLFIHAAIRDVRPIIRTEISDGLIRQGERLVHFQEKKRQLEKRLAAVNTQIDNLLPDAISLEVAAYRGYLRNLSNQC